MFHQSEYGHRFSNVLYLSFFQHFLKESQNFKLKCRFGKLPGGLVGFRFDKKQYHGFHWKNYHCISIWKFKFCNVFFIRVRYGIDFQRCHICRFFSKIKRSENFCVNKFLFCSKKDNVIFLFQWKLWYCFFQIWNPGGLQEAFRSCILVWSFDFFPKSAEKTTI